MFLLHEYAVLVHLKCKPASDRHTVMHLRLGPICKRLQLVSMHPAMHEQHENFLCLMKGINASQGSSIRMQSRAAASGAVTPSQPGALHQARAHIQFVVTSTA